MLQKNRSAGPSPAAPGRITIGFSLDLTPEQVAHLDAIVAATNLKMGRQSYNIASRRTLFWSRRSTMAKLLTDYLEAVTDPEAAATAVLKDMNRRAVEAMQRSRPRGN